MTTYAVYEIYPNGVEEEVGTISVEKDSIEQSKMLSKYDTHRSYYSDMSYARYIVLTVFEQIYGFTKGLNGFDLTWEDFEKVGSIYWRIATWRVRKIEDEPLQS